MHLHHHEDVLEVRADVLGAEGLGSGFLEHDGDDVVPDVALPEQLQVMEHRGESPACGTSTALINLLPPDLPAACC